MKSITKKIVSIPLFLSVMALSCQKEGKSESNPVAINQPHNLTVFLTDDETPAFDSIFIDLRDLEIKVEEDSNSNGRWITVPVRSGVYNILRLRNGIDTIFGAGGLPNARIEKLRLTLGHGNLAYKNGQSIPLNLHDDDQQVEVELDHNNFDVTSPGQARLWIDFDAAHSIVSDNSGHGNNNGFRLKSHLHIFGKSKSGSLEGRVLPTDAHVIVMAIAGTDTSMAISDDREGEFKFMGLRAGIYKILYDGRNGFMDTAVANIMVTDGEDEHLPVITLHH